MPYLKPEEAMIYFNLGRTQLAKKCEEYPFLKIITVTIKREAVECSPKKEEKTTTRD
jgi:hypothetical protein